MRTEKVLIGLIVLIIAVIVWLRVRDIQQCHKRGGEMVVVGSHWQIQNVYDGKGNIISSYPIEVDDYACSVGAP